MGPNATRQLISDSVKKLGLTVLLSLSGTAGTAYYVDSANTNASNLNTGLSTSTQGPGGPWATLAYAVTKVAANKGDAIFLMPTHAETISAAAGILMDSTVVAGGYSIIGVGQGQSRPTFTWSATASTWKITAANVTISNIITKVSIDEVVSMFDVRGAGVTFDAADFIETTSCQAIQWLLTTAAADYLTIRNCVHRQITAAAAAQKWIQLVAGSYATIEDNKFIFLANASTSSQLIAGTTAVVWATIQRNLMLWTGATINTIVNLVTTSTALINENRAASGTSVSTAGAFTCDAGFFWENRWLDTVQVSGLLAPVVDTDT